jgi:hypothetical protein
MKDKQWCLKQHLLPSLDNIMKDKQGHNSLPTALIASCDKLIIFVFIISACIKILHGANEVGPVKSRKQCKQATRNKRGKIIKKRLRSVLQTFVRKMFVE